MEEEDAFLVRSRSSSLDSLWPDLDKEISSSKQPDQKGSTYILAGEREGAITCRVSVNGDYLKVTGALHEVVTDALRELADVSAKHLDGRGKLGSEYTMITRRGRRTNKLRRWIEQKDKKDRGVKPKAPDVSRAFEVITLAKAAQEASNVSYTLWPVSAKQRRQNLIDGPPPKVQKVEEEEDYGNHNNNNNLYESVESFGKSEHKYEERIDELLRENQRLDDQLHRIQTKLIRDNIVEENGKEMQNRLKEGEKASMERRRWEESKWTEVDELDGL